VLRPAFDHLLVQPKLHEWLFRRWSSFLISTQCVTVLVVSYGLGLALGLHPTLMWWITIGTLALAFVSNSIISWREMYKMFDFAVDVKAVRRQSAAHPHAIAPKTGIDVTARTA
jgi:hypothetical protein